MSTMSPEEYHRERDALKAAYGDGSRADLSAKRDQALAKLFAKSGWSQDRIAAEEGMSRQWVTTRIRFGHFLLFATTVADAPLLPPGLSERRFRQFWTQTDQAETNDRIRFGQVLRLLDGVALPPAPHGKNLKIGPDIVTLFTDGKWHRLDEIVEILEKPEEDVKRTLDLMVEKGTYKTKAEGRTRGRDKHPEYRIFSREKTVSVSELAEKLGPIIKELTVEGKKNMTTMLPANVLMYAIQLQRHLDEWTE